MRSWSVLQSEIADWSLHNFGLQLAHQPMLGLIEEVGEFLAAREQFVNIGSPAYILRRESLTDALADQTIYALNLCEIVGLDFQFMNQDFKPVFPDPSPASLNLSDAELLGTLALAARAVLKHEQSIRGYDDLRRKEELGVCLRNWLGWANFQVGAFCEEGRTLLGITRTVWDQVRKRDWKKNPRDANKVALQDDLAAGK